MLFTEKQYKFMYNALQLAESALEEGEIPIGAVVVHSDKIIGKGWNQVEKLNDATAHAEMIALTSAENYLKNKFLTGCDIYVTVEPCLMCAGALVNARISRLFFGAQEPKFGACGSLYNIPDENKFNHKIEVFGGLYELESSHLMKEFFSMKRNSGNSI